MELPTFLPLADAARKYQIPESMLTQLAQSGKIEAAYFNGEIFVSDKALTETKKRLDETKTKEEIIAEEFAHLVGQTLTVAQAAQKYNVTEMTIRRWVARGYIKTSGAYPVQLGEDDVAYCAKIYHERKASGTRSGVPLLGFLGQPYELKHPKLHEYRRRKKAREESQN